MTATAFSRRQLALAAAGAALVGPRAFAQPAPAASQPSVSTTRPVTDRERQLREDFPWLARYAADNEALKRSGMRPSIVFMGDSITERWQRTRPDYFTPQRICRGISGQTTPQMVLRMMADVIALRPRAVHILGGTNDIAGNTGPMTLEQTRDNVFAMAMLAKTSGLKVLIGSIPPAGAFRWSPDKRPAEPIRQGNALLRAVAARLGATWLDYHAVLATPDGAMRPDFATDGVHPLAPGYAAMEGVLTPHLIPIERSGW